MRERVNIANSVHRSILRKYTGNRTCHALQLHLCNTNLSNIRSVRVIYVYVLLYIK